LNVALFAGAWVETFCLAQRRYGATVGGVDSNVAFVVALRETICRFLRGSVEGKPAIKALSHKSYIPFLCLCVLVAELLQIIVFSWLLINLPLKKAIEKIKARL